MSHEYLDGYCSVLFCYVDSLSSDGRFQICLRFHYCDLLGSKFLFLFAKSISYITKIHFISSRKIIFLNHRDFRYSSDYPNQ